MNHRNGAVVRIAAAVPEQWRELEVSLRELARLSGVSRTTITNVEKGRAVEPTLLLQIATTLTLLELYAPRAPIEVQDVPAPLLAYQQLQVGSAA